MNSIRSKLIKNLLIIIISTIVILDVLTIIGLKKYYYKNIENTLENQIDSSINFYNKYFSNQNLIENVYDNVDAFWNNSDIQVEVLDETGNLLMDSYGIRDDKLLQTPDIEKAIKGEKGVWTGKIDYYTSRVMVISKALVSNNKNIGIVRLVYSLNEIDKTINSFSVLFLGISFIVVIVAIIISLILAKDIIEPLNKIIVVAKEMAKGNLDVRSNISDTVELNQLSNTLNFMASEIDKRDRLKNEFISSVSHELRTPLTSIKGWAVTLNDDYTDRETIKLGLDIIEKETDRLTKMVEELLDFSKLINGIVSLNRTECDIKKFIQHIEDFMMPRADREEKNFTVSIENNLGNALLDKNRMKQVLINIIDNAFKFTGKDGVIELNVKKEGRDIIFSIKDNGSGIDKEDLERVKEKFFKGKNSKAKNGIGLSISDEIIKMHKGTFIIESEINKGTTIYITIPIFMEGK